MAVDLSLSEARRLALAAQGFHEPRPARPTLRHLRSVIRRLGLLQIDYFNVLGPAHYHVPFSRLGPYDRNLLHQLVYQRREFTEHWAHEASIVPMESWPLLHYRRQTYRVRPIGFETFLQQHPEYVEHVLEEVRVRGPLLPEGLGHPEGVERRMEHSWFGTVPRAVLEDHFGRGRIAIADRLPDFSRVYELAERMIPPEHFSRRVERDDAQRQLLLQAARAHGVGTAADLADYYRMSVLDARPRLAELVASGALREAAVETWREPAYLDPEARVPVRIQAAAVLSPFDPVVWFRPRVRRLFHFDYRVEIFVPPDQRKWGCFVLPFLLDDRLVARVDLKADRAAKRLLVPAAYLEPGSEADAVVPALAAELHSLAGWLGLKTVRIGRRGSLANALRKMM